MCSVRVGLCVMLGHVVCSARVGLCVMLRHVCV